ncbi:MAG: bifunctional (p)ppGpp synthetase/guanosine-3',5'-bis(diphosphate) 3'-pyrophosphohydrolase [Clostridiales bacterium]|nr:bifunctional (p)ppGpp synthetase/guanosine-3',5'-bis(diphosphate) 3'-pyrophosphohydrolase [Clostridiales bacterium]
MYNIKLELEKNFALTGSHLEVLEQIEQNIQVTQKDVTIISDLIKYKLDAYSVFAYLVCEHNIFDKITNQEILILAKNLQEINSDAINLNRQEELEILRKQFIAMCKDIRVIIIKLCLVLYSANLCELPLSQNNRELLLTIRNIYAPLSERLGLNKMKSELEDLCLKFLDTQIYNELKQNVLLKQEENQKQIELTKSKLENILQELKLDNAIIMARQKHFSSIYKKIQSKNVPLAKIYDLIAMRVIVDTIEDCYAVLGKIHGIYKPMEGRFKDYVASPKPNGYQSIHTTIIAENQRPLEIQIRTHEMHKNSEFGVDVAHWIYKEKRKTTELDKKLAWLREIMDNSASLSSEEFVETLKTNLYSGRIFVQTPKGKVLEFPEGACVIDFAYAIHSDVGNYCVGGKINNKMVAINTKLNNNDIVEILTSTNSKGPSRDWLSIVKTAEARDKINAFFKKELKEENIKNGTQILEIAIKNKGLQPAKVLEAKNFDGVLRKYAFNTIDEVLAAVGYGSISTNQILNKVLLEYEKNNQPEKPEKSMLTLTVKKNKDGVLVDGDSGMMVRFAGCCNPILGEDIIGYISRGRGVTIHKCDCQNLQYLEQERLIKAEWADKSAKYKIANLNIFAKVEDSVITKITLLIANMQFSLLEFETKIFADKMMCRAKVKVNDNADTERIVSAIKKLDNILEVESK